MSIPLLSCLPPKGSSTAITSSASSLIEDGARINYPALLAIHSPLALAMRHDEPMLVELLIRKGALVVALSISTDGIMIPLCEVVCSGRYQTVQLLLAEGAHVSSLPQLRPDLIPHISIQLAAHYEYLKILKLLLETLDNRYQFMLGHPLALRLAQRAVHRAVACYLQAYRTNIDEQLECATDEMILANLEDEREDRRYWYEFWKDERYKAWKTIRYNYILQMYSDPSSMDEEIVVESKHINSNAAATTSKEDGRRSASDTNNHEDHLDWQAHFDFDTAQYLSDMNTGDPVMEDVVVQTFPDQCPPADVSQTPKSNIIVPIANVDQHNTSLDPNGHSMIRALEGSDLTMLGEQIWDSDTWIDRESYDGFHEGEPDQNAGP